MTSNEPFDLSDDYNPDDPKDEQYILLTLPFTQSRIISVHPELMEPVYESEHYGKQVRVFAGDFLQINEATDGYSSVHMPDLVGIIVADQRGRTLVYDTYNEFYVGWLSPSEYEFITPFNTEYNSKWMQ